MNLESNLSKFNFTFFLFCFYRGKSPHLARLIMQIIQKIEVFIEAGCFEKTTCRVNLRTNLGGTIHPRLDPVE